MASGHMRGYSLIELMVALGVAGVLLMLAIPAFGEWVSNAQIRSLAESLQNGLRQARQEAARQNRSFVFILTSASAPSCASYTASSSGNNWLICPVADSALDTLSTTGISGFGKAGGSSATVSASFSSVIFDGMGRTNLASDATLNIGQSSKSCEADGGSARCLRIVLSAGGKLRLCDPQLTAGTPAACS